MVVDARGDGARDVGGNWSLAFDGGRDLRLDEGDEAGVDLAVRRLRDFLTLWIVPVGWLFVVHRFLLSGEALGSRWWIAVQDSRQRNRLRSKGFSSHKVNERFRKAVAEELLGQLDCADDLA